MKCIVKYYDEYYSKYVRRVCVCLGGGSQRVQYMCLCLFAWCLYVCMFVGAMCYVHLKHF